MLIFFSMRFSLLEDGNCLRFFIIVFNLFVVIDLFLFLLKSWKVF